MTKKQFEQLKDGQAVVLIRHKERTVHIFREECLRPLGYIFGGNIYRAKDFRTPNSEDLANALKAEEDYYKKVVKMIKDAFALAGVEE